MNNTGIEAYRSLRTRWLSRRSVYDRAVGRHEAQTLRQLTVAACRHRTRNKPDDTCDREPCVPSRSDLELADIWNT